MIQPSSQYVRINRSIVLTRRRGRNDLAGNGSCARAVIERRQRRIRAIQHYNAQIGPAAISEID
jgi:hypothetical protein